MYDCLHYQQHPLAKDEQKAKAANFCVLDREGVGEGDLYHHTLGRQITMCLVQPELVDPCPTPCEDFSSDVVFRSSAVLAAASLVVFAWLF